MKQTQAVPPLGHATLNKVEFLWDTLRYFENRISMVDTKAAAIIAIETAFFALTGLLADEKYLRDLQPSTKWAALGFAGSFAGLIVFLLLHAIRPSKNWITRGTSIVPLNDSTLLWPLEQTDPKGFARSVSDLAERNMQEELANAIFVRHQLLKRKYKSYDWALWLAKLQVISMVFLFLLGTYLAVVG